MVISFKGVGGSNLHKVHSVDRTPIRTFFSAIESLKEFS